MTDDMHIPRRLEGEHENILGFNTLKTDAAPPPPAAAFIESGDNLVNRVSVEALINVLIKRGLCTANELLAEENRLHAWRATTPSLDFTPVQIQRESHARPSHKPQAGNRLRRLASKRQWSRRLGTLLFGWKWHRRKKEQ